jgi:hypothetical protein
MYFTNFLAESAFPPAVIAHEVSSPKPAGSEPFGPRTAVTNPLFFAIHAGSAVHCGQLGFASFRSPAISSRMNDDHTIMAALPAK